MRIILFCAFYLALVALLSGCQKEQDYNNRETSGAYQVGLSVEDRAAAVSCENIPPQTNFVTVTFNEAETGRPLPAACFTEQELLGRLQTGGGVNQEKIGTLLSNLFYKAEASTPAKVADLAPFLAESFDPLAGAVAGSFNIDVMGRMDYPALPNTGSLAFAGPAPGFIDFYTVRQAKTTAGYPLILQSGFSGLRFRNQCTQALATFTFPNTLDGFVKMLREAGFSAESANMVVANITAGKYSIRQVWDLFQLRVAPRLPFVKNLLSGNSAQCWRLSQVGIGLYNAKFNTASFYFAQGNGALK